LIEREVPFREAGVMDPKTESPSGRQPSAKREMPGKEMKLGFYPVEDMGEGKKSSIKKGSTK